MMQQISRFMFVAPGQRRRRSPRKRALNGALVVTLLLLCIGYVHFLNVSNTDAGRQIGALRDTDPARYLADLRQREGFGIYLEQYAARYNATGADGFRIEAPDFLLGRWALFEAPQRDGDRINAAGCADFLAIEDGTLRLSGTPQTRYPVRYRIAGPTVEVRRDDASMLPITLVSYGRALNHIVLTLPGAERPRYGYACR